MTLDEAMAYVRSKGIEIVREQFTPRTFWGRQAGILDPSGNHISMREWHAPDGPEFKDWQPRVEGVSDWREAHSGEVRGLLRRVWLAADRPGRPVVGCVRLGLSPRLAPMGRDDKMLLLP